MTSGTQCYQLSKAHMRLTRKPLVRIIHPIHSELFLTHSSGKITFPVHSRMHLKTILRTNKLSYKGKKYDINEFEAVPALSFLGVWIVACFWGVIVLALLWLLGLSTSYWVAGCIFILKLLFENRIHTNDTKLANLYNQSSHITLLSKTEQE